MTAPRDEPLTESVVDGLSARAYVVPTTTGGRAEPETDGTARWDSTGVLVVEVRAAGQVGLGYAYTAPAALAVVRDTLSDVVVGGDPLATQRAFWRMASAVRNLGWSGVCAGAVSAVDIALHDLRARLLGVSLVRLLGGAGDRVMAYGSGGFTSYSEAELENQLSGWAAQGLRAVKMKVGRDPADDLARVRTARAAIGPATALFVDANGAYERKQALGFAERFAELDVTWFEEPVSSDDLDGLRLLRDRAPSGMQVAAGEYGYTPSYFHAMLAAGAVDTLQADATRCGGVTGFILAAALAQGAGVPVSAHTAPALHATLGAALPNVVHVEYFHDHALIEDRFFDGGPELCAGDLRPDPESPGHGLAFAESRAEPYLRGEWAS
jgi:L-alanine-DL-glutamate epimerase-like enolase superfamily enzyme